MHYRKYHISGSKRIPRRVIWTSLRNVRPLWRTLSSLLLLASKILFWIPAESDDDRRSLLSLESSVPGLSMAVVSYTFFRYLSRTTVARRFLGIPRFVGGGAFSACSSLALYYSEAPIHSIMLRMVASLERARPASSILIHIEADQVVGLLVIHIEPGPSAIAVVPGVPLRPN
jgi:hypothetical protein